MRLYRVLLTLLLAGLWHTPVQAEQSVASGDFAIHYSAFPTSSLQPEIAKSYNITRSNKRGMINIAVLKRVMGTTGQPVHARVDAKVTNLHGQVSPITMRELNEQGAVYYIGEFAIANEESLRFEIEVTPEGQAESIRAAFDQVFFVD